MTEKSAINQSTSLDKRNKWLMINYVQLCNYNLIITLIKQIRLCCRNYIVMLIWRWYQFRLIYAFHGHRIIFTPILIRFVSISRMLFMSSVVITGLKTVNYVIFALLYWAPLGSRGNRDEFSGCQKITRNEAGEVPSGEIENNFRSQG